MDDAKIEDLRLKMLDAKESDLRNPDFLFNVAKSVEERLPHQYEYIIAKSYRFYDYVEHIIKKRWYDGEEIFLEHSSYSVPNVFYKYAKKYCGGRWKEAEQIMARKVERAKEVYEREASNWNEYVAETLKNV